MSQLVVIPVSKVHVNTVALREVNTASEKFLGIVESIRNKGFLSAVTVRPFTDESGKVVGGEYQLVDGLHRFTAAKMVGLDEINAVVVSATDAEVLELQILSNVHRVETQPREYAAQLLRMLAINPTMTQTELATKLGKSPQWLMQILRLNKIDNTKINELINDGHINVSNAYALAKLPAEELADWVEKAQTLPNGQFAPMVDARVKEVRESKRQGREAAPPTFKPVEHMRKISEVRAGITDFSTIDAVIKAENAKTTAEVATAILKWVLNVDVISVDKARSEWEAMQAEKAEKAAKRKADNAAKKALTAKANADAAADAGGDSDDDDGEIND